MLTACLLITALAEPTASLHEWDFREPGCPIPQTYACTAQLKDGTLQGDIADGGAYMIFPAVSIPTPVRVRMRIMTDDKAYGEGEIYWLTEDGPTWGMDQFQRFPIQHDGAWHNYDVPLAASGGITQFRLSVGWKPGHYAIEFIRFEADPYPDELADSRARMAPEVAVEDATVKVVLDTALHRFAITDKRTGRVWIADGAVAKAVLASAETRGPTTMCLDLLDWSTRTHYACNVTLPSPGTVRFELDTAHPDRPFYALNAYPPPLVASTPLNGKVLFCQRSAGVYIEQTDTTYRNRMLRVYGNTDTVNMPWIGLVDETTGEGVMALAETPCDAWFVLKADADQRIWPQILWDNSMSSFRYKRTFSYRFSPSGGYVNLARMYRDHARETGKLVTLEEKAARKPAVPMLKGAPMVWGGTDAWQWAREARTEGLRRAVISNATHGLNDKQALRRLNAMGYITLDYDNVSDISDGPTGFQSDSVAETANHVLPGLGPMGGWDDGVVKRSVRSSAFALRALQSYVPKELETYGFNGRFVDVSLAVDLNEDYHPMHTFDRRQDMAYRRAAMGWLAGKGLVMGAEHGNDWGIDLFEYTEGSLGGPFWWKPQKDWNAGMLLRPKSRDAYDADYLKYGNGFDTRIPLWQLVYHDCAISTWYWGDTPGFHCQTAPEISDRKDLFTILYGGVPLFWRDRTDYDWRSNRARFLRSYHDTCPWSECVAFRPMLSHAFLSDDRAVQRADFDGGYAVGVNFSDQPRPYTDAKGESRQLAPLGFYAEGPEIVHSRLWIDGESVTSITKPDYVRYETKARLTMGAVTLSGECVAFQAEPDRWQIATAPRGQYSLDVGKLTGWNPGQRYVVLSLDDVGECMGVGAPVDLGSPLVLLPERDGRFHAIVTETNAPPVVMYPVDPWVEVGTALQLSSGIADATVRYTLDGSEPVATSPVYKPPLLVSGPVTLSARAFAGDRALGEVVTRGYRAVKTLYRSGLVRGGDAPKEIDVALDGATELRVLVGNGGDFCWSDWTDLGDAKFVGEADAMRYLSALEPVYAFQTYQQPARDKSAKDGGPIAMKGRVFDHGLSLFSEAELRYSVPPDIRRFTATVGLDDRADPKGSPHPALMGSVEITIQGVLR